MSCSITLYPVSFSDVYDDPHGTVRNEFVRDVMDEYDIGALTKETHSIYYGGTRNGESIVAFVYPDGSFFVGLKSHYETYGGEDHIVVDEHMFPPGSYSQHLEGDVLILPGARASL